MVWIFVLACNGSVFTIILTIDWTHRTIKPRDHKQQQNNKGTHTWAAGAAPPTQVSIILEPSFLPSAPQWQIEDWGSEGWMGLWSCHAPAHSFKDRRPLQYHSLRVIRQCSSTLQRPARICVILSAAWISPTALCHWELMQKGSKGGFVQI